MKKISEEWLKAAKDDLRVADKIITDETLTHMVAFHSQQCIEKSLKAVMEEYGIHISDYLTSWEMRVSAPNWSAQQRSAKRSYWNNPIEKKTV